MLGNVAFSAVAFLAALGLLIAIHEYGHFAVARAVGIKVLRYSIGFGKPLLKRTGRRDGTEYVLAAIPLGGYVKMLDEREAPVAAHERDRAFNAKPLWARTAVVVAGPLANFLLAILAYWVVLMIGMSGVAPLIGAPEPGSAAARAGFENEDRIVAVAGVETPTWADARIALLEASLDADAPVAIEVESLGGERAVRRLPIDARSMLQADGDAVSALGFSPWWPDVPPRAGEIVAGGAAERAGVLPGDLVERVDGASVATWRELVAAVRPHPGEAIELVVSRDGAERTLSIVPEPITVGGIEIGRIGIVETGAQQLAERAEVVVREPPLQAFTGAVARTWNMSVLTLRMLGKLVVGEASLDNVSGPISIAQFAGQSASIGIDHYINFIALISISLAVLNLLPVPMLDGGHLLYFAIEAVRGKPLSERAQLVGQQVGIAALGGLMFLAFYNDIGRLLG